MPSHAHATNADPFLLWSRLAMKTLEMSTAATQVIAIRTARMAAAGINPGPADQREMSRMGTEKVDAFSRAGSAIANGAIPVVADMAGQAFRSAMDLYLATTHLASSRTLPQTMQRQRALTHVLMQHSPAVHHGSAAAARLAHRALEPVHATATANAKRLTRVRPGA